MVQHIDESGLSLSLTFPASNRTAHASSPALELNPMPPSSPFNLLHNNTWTPSSPDHYREMETCRVERRWSFTGIDVNRLPADMEEKTRVSSPNSTLSSLSGNKRSLVIQKRSDDVLECSRSDEEDADNSRKKLMLSKHQSAILEETFKEHNTLNPNQKIALGKKLGLRPRQVEVWFQNRRARRDILSFKDKVEANRV